MASDLKTYGEDHPFVAIRRSDLRMAWMALGEYQRPSTISSRPWWFSNTVFGLGRTLRHEKT